MELDQDASYYSTIPGADGSKAYSEDDGSAPVKSGENNEYNEIGPPVTADKNTPYYLSLKDDYAC